MDVKGYLNHLIEINLENEECRDMNDIVDVVLEKYIHNLYQNSFFINLSRSKDVKDEIRDEIIEITRIKTYGCYDLEEYRKTKLKKT